MTTQTLTLREWISSTPEKPWQNQPLPTTHLPGGAEEMVLTLTEDRDQIWQGFGGCFNELGWIALNKIRPTEKDNFFQELFSGNGSFRFNFCRLPIGANDYSRSWYSHNETEGDFAMEHFSIDRDQENILPFLKEALRVQSRIKLFASPWSPPVWMKFPAAHNHGTLIWEKEYLEAYALYLVKFVQAYANEKVPISQIHVQNEPDSDQKFPSCLWTGEKFRSFIRDHLQPAFCRAGLNTEIWIGTFERGNYADWIQPVMSDPVARKAVSGMGFQWAGRDLVQRAHASWPDVPKIQTENECGDGKNSWDYAAYVFDLLQHYIANGVNAYVYWNMVLEAEGRSTWGWKQNSMFTVDVANRCLIRNPEYYAMRHYTSDIYPGAKRIRLKGEWSALATAFENAEGNSTIVIRNPSAEPKILRLQKGENEVSVCLPPLSMNTLRC